MAVFNYKAREKDGTIVSGTIEASERRVVAVDASEDLAVAEAAVDILERGEDLPPGLVAGILAAHDQLRADAPLCAVAHWESRGSSPNRSAMRARRGLQAGRRMAMWCKAPP